MEQMSMYLREKYKQQCPKGYEILCLLNSELNSDYTSLPTSADLWRDLNSKNQFLSLETIKVLAQYNIDNLKVLLHSHQNIIPLDLLLEYKDKLDWYEVAEYYQNLTSEFIENNWDLFANCKCPKGGNIWWSIAYFQYQIPLKFYMKHIDVFQPFIEMIVKRKTLHGYLD